MTTQTQHNPPVELGAYSVEEFCQAHRISKAFFYLLRRDGRGPETFKAGRRTLVSLEAAVAWRNGRAKGAGHDQK